MDSPKQLGKIEHSVHVDLRFVHGSYQAAPDTCELSVEHHDGLDCCNYFSSGHDAKLLPAMWVAVRPGPLVALSAGLPG